MLRLTECLNKKANHMVCFLWGVEGIWTPDEDFADPCLTTWTRRHIHNEDCWLKCIPIYNPPCLSGRWDSNPRPSPWQGDVLPLYYARISWLTFSLECRDPGSDWGHRDFQSRALPTELSRQDVFFLLSVRDFTRTYMYCQEMIIGLIIYVQVVLTFYHRFDIMLGRYLNR